MAHVCVTEIMVCLCVCFVQKKPMISESDDDDDIPLVSFTFSSNSTVLATLLYMFVYTHVQASRRILTKEAIPKATPIRPLHPVKEEVDGLGLDMKPKVKVKVCPYLKEHLHMYVVAHEVVVGVVRCITVHLPPLSEPGENRSKERGFV